MTNQKCAVIAAILFSFPAIAGPAKDETLKDGSQVTRISGAVSVNCLSGCSGGTGGGGTFGQATMASSSPVVIASNQSPFTVNAAQSGGWTMGRNWNLGSATDLVGAVQSGAWSTGRTWSLSSGADSIAAIESGAWNITNITGTVSLPTGASTSANQTSELTKLDTLHTDLTTTQPRKLQDGSGNAITSQANGTQRPLDVGVNVSGVQVDPRAIRALTSSDVITALQSGTWIVQPGNTANSTPWLMALAAGSAKVGQFAIDQTTPGTTNLVSIGTNGTVAITSAAATAKGTQGANGIPTQDLKDAGRTAVSLYVESFAGAATEALLTLNQSEGYATATTGTSYTVPAGKTLRLTAICAAFVSTTTTANTSRLRIRVNTGGAAALTSPIAFSMIYGWPSATFIANEAQTVCHQLPDGLEIPAGSGVGVTHLEAAANGTVSVQLNGFRY